MWALSPLQFMLLKLTCESCWLLPAYFIMNVKGGLLWPFFLRLAFFGMLLRPCLCDGWTDQCCLSWSYLWKGLISFDLIGRYRDSAGEISLDLSFPFLRTWSLTTWRCWFIELILKDRSTPGSIVDTLFSIIVSNGLVPLPFGDLLPLFWSEGMLVMIGEIYPNSSLFFWFVPLLCRPARPFSLD